MTRHYLTVIWHSSLPSTCFLGGIWLKSNILALPSDTSPPLFPIRIHQLPIDLTPMIALAYLYHGSSECYIEEIFELSNSSEHPLNFTSFMTLISGSDDANVCFSRINQGEHMSHEKYRTKIENVQIPYTHNEKMNVTMHLNIFQDQLRSGNTESNALSYLLPLAQITMKPNKVTLSI